MDPETEMIVALARKGMVPQAIEYGERIGMKNLAELITEGLVSMPAISL